VSDQRRAQGVVIGGLIIPRQELDLLVDLQNQIRIAAQILPPSRAGAINDQGDAVSVVSELLQP